MASKVYFADLRADVHENLQQKLTRLMKTAGMGDIDFQDKFVAIKLHFGEPGNLAFLRPNWARTVADFVKERGGKPFLTDCNTLYVGGRKNALDHMDSAMLNGFNPMTTGCQIIIADGLKGSDEVEVPVAGGEYVKSAKIGRAVMDADVFISLTHFKGHETAGFGGCLKNIGMGCGSRAGKMEQHNAGEPHVAEKYCIGCGQCRRICAHGAPIIESGKAHIDHDKCVGCGRCIAQLIRRFREDGQFPHEVGLFLSYPPEDVQGFIDHRACDFKCAGLWKVYGDERRALRLFSRFKHCTEDYCARWQTGWDIDRLAVATRRAGTQPASDTFRRPGLCGGGKCDTIAAMS